MNWIKRIRRLLSVVEYAWILFQGAWRGESICVAASSFGRPDNTFHILRGLQPEEDEGLVETLKFAIAEMELEVIPKDYIERDLARGKG